MQRCVAGGGEVEEVALAVVKHVLVAHQPAAGWTRQRSRLVACCTADDDSQPSGCCTERCNAAEPGKPAAPSDRPLTHPQHLLGPHTRLHNETITLASSILGSTPHTHLLQAPPALTRQVPGSTRPAVGLAGSANTLSHCLRSRCSCSCSRSCSCCRGGGCTAACRPPLRLGRRD